MTTPTRYTNGVSSEVTGVFRDLPFLNPTSHVTYFNDFLAYNAADWTITEVEAGAGDASIALADGFGGWLVLTNDDADNDAISMQLDKESFKFAANKKCFFEVRFKISDATQSDILFGLVITDTTPLAFTDGVAFRKDDGDADIDFASLKDSAGTTATAATTIANDTFVKLGFVFDGLNFKLFKDGALLQTLDAATIPDDEDLSVTFHVQNGEAVAKNMTVDYIYVAQER